MVSATTAVVGRQRQANEVRGRAAVLDVDLATDHEAIEGLHGHTQALVLIRWRGHPIGLVDLPIVDDRVTIDAIRDAAHRAHGDALARHRVSEHFAGARAEEHSRGLLEATVIVCTRERPTDLARCLERLRAVCPADVGILVVDNAPATDATRGVAAALGVAYACEPRPGLAWARTCGMTVADTPVVLFTDDDVVVDAEWPNALRRPFADPDVSAVTGLVLPLELETPAQAWFELHYGFSARGFARREFDARTLSPLAAGSVGAGASMAVRRELALSLGIFATELGPGTAAQAADDTYGLYRLLSRGHVLVYTPEAVAWHRHRRDEDALLRQVRGYGTATACLLLRLLVEHAEGDALSMGWWHLRHHFLARLWHGARADPEAPPLALTLAELRGWLGGPSAFWQSRRAERRHLAQRSQDARRLR